MEEKLGNQADSCKHGLSKEPKYEKLVKDKGLIIDNLKPVAGS